MKSPGGPFAHLWDSLCCYLVCSVNSGHLVLAGLMAPSPHLRESVGSLMISLPMPWSVFSLKVISWGKRCSFPIPEGSLSSQACPTWAGHPLCSGLQPQERRASVGSLLRTHPGQARAGRGQKLHPEHTKDLEGFCSHPSSCRPSAQACLHTP